MPPRSRPQLSYSRHRPCVAHRDKRCQLSWIDGLSHVKLKPCGQCTTTVRLLTPSGNREKYDLPSPRLGAQLCRDVIVSEIRHADAQQSDLRPHAPGAFQGLAPAVRHMHSVTLRLEKHARCIGTIPVVIGNQ